MKPLHPFFVALQFLTRIPVPTFDAQPQAITRSLAYYPAVGLLLGLLLAALSWLLSNADPSVRSALVLAVWVALTGALHLDGVADCADAWVAGMGDRAHTLAVMKDPYCGPMGVVAVALVIVLKFAALHGLRVHEWLPLALVPMLARGVIPLLFMTTPYVRPGGLGSALAAAPSRAANKLVVAITAVFVLVAGGRSGAWILLTLAVVFLLLRRAMIGRLGGTTGDTAGALIEIGETGMLLALALT